MPRIMKIHSVRSIIVRVSNNHLYEQEQIESQEAKQDSNQSFGKEIGKT